MEIDSPQSKDGSLSGKPALQAGGERERVRFLRSVIYLALGQVGMTTLAILLNAILARTLGARDFGVYFVVNSITVFAYVIVEWGQPTLVLRETAQDPQRAGELLGTALVLRVLGAAVVLVLLPIATFLLGYDSSTVFIIVVYFIAVLPMSLAQSFGTVFRSFDHMDLDALVSVINSATNLALVVVALACGGGLIAVALCQLMAGIVSLGMGRRFYRRLRAAPLALRRLTARNLWGGGAVILSFTVVQAVQPCIDGLLISKLVPPEAVGWFGIARNIIGTLLAPGVILATAAFPQLSRTANLPDQFGVEVRNALRPMMLIGALGSAGTFLFADFAVEVIGGKVHYAPAITILQVFSPTLLLLFVDILFGRALFAANRVKTFTAIKVVSVVISTVLDVVLIPWFQVHHGNGGIGAIVAFALSELFVFAGLVSIMPHAALRLQNVAEAVKAIATALLTVLLLKSISGLPPLAGIPLTVLVFFVIASGLGLVRRTDLALLSNLAGQRG